MKTQRAPEVAVRCAWCLSWASPEDADRYRKGARVTHSICDTCEDKHFGDVA